jgi:homoserine/homoserine lactone efflux protein
MPLDMKTACEKCEQALDASAEAYICSFECTFCAPRTGFVVQGANPKALVFFMALLPQFIDPRAGVVHQVVVLGVSSVVIELAALSAYGYATVRARRFAGGRVRRGLQRIGGGLLVAVGGRLAAAAPE